MTTGRINQVTILDLGAGARRHNPPREVEYTKQGAAEATPIARLASAQGANAAGDRFNCPH